MIHNMNFIIDLLLVVHDEDEPLGDLVTGDDRAGLVSIILPSLFVLSCNTGDE